jgi:hypothetical protein
MTSLRTFEDKYALVWSLGIGLVFLLDSCLDLSKYCFSPCPHVRVKCDVVTAACLSDGNP